MDNLQEKIKFVGYKMTFRFNASHSMTDKTRLHAHTFLVNIYIKKETNAFIEFIEYEKAIVKYINQYKGQYLNDFFDEIPTLEFLCIKFYNDIEYILQDIEAFNLISVELGDSPIKTVKVGKEIVASRASIFIDTKLYDMCEKGLGIRNEN